MYIFVYIINHINADTLGYWWMIPLGTNSPPGNSYISNSPPGNSYISNSPPGLHICSIRTLHSCFIWIVLVVIHSFWFSLFLFRLLAYLMKHIVSTTLYIYVYITITWWTIRYITITWWTIRYITITWWTISSQGYHPPVAQCKHTKEIQIETKKKYM
jgi:hypothetical protein